jgi:hypothetical protein
MARTMINNDVRPRPRIMEKKESRHAAFLSGGQAGGGAACVVTEWEPANPSRQRSPTTTGGQVTSCPVVADPESASCCARRRRHKIGEPGSQGSHPILPGPYDVEAGVRQKHVGTKYAGAGCWSKNSPSGFWREELGGLVRLRRCGYLREASRSCLAASENAEPNACKLISLPIRPPRCTTTQSRTLHTDAVLLCLYACGWRTQVREGCRDGGR